MRKLLAIILVGIVALSFGGCKKKEAKPQLPPGHPGMEGGMPSSGMPNMPKKDRQVVVPAEVKAKWKAVQINIEDKTAKSTKAYTIPVGSDLAVPNTNIKITVLAFLPDFRMGDSEITSVSDKPNNPAAQVVIQEQGKEEWKGWLYSLHPEIHSYQHPTLGVILIGGVSK
ncbi:MAG TPA: DUF2155 domain-containing protein [Nitrospirota bacterium]